MMIRPVETVNLTPVKGDLPVSPKGRGIVENGKALFAEAKPLDGAESLKSLEHLESLESGDKFLQELLMGSEGLNAQPPLPKNTPLLTNDLSREVAAPAKNGFAKSPAPANRALGESKQAFVASQGLTGATLTNTPAKPASVLAVPPQNEELRQILAEAFPSEVGEQLSKSETDGPEVSGGKVAPAKAEVRDSEQFIALQSLPAQLKLKSLGAGERQKAAYAQGNPKLQMPDAVAPESSSSLKTPLVASLPQFKKVKSTEGSPQPSSDGANPRIDLSQLEQVLSRGVASELVLNQPDQPAVQIKPRLNVDGHVTTGSMARERLSSQTILGLQGAVRDLSRQGGGEIQIRLKPEALGEIKLQVATRGSQVGIRVHAENPHAARLLEQSLDSLRDRLGEQNLKLGHIEFSSNPSSTLMPVRIGDQPLVETTPVWTQPTLPNSLSPNMADTGSAAHRESQFEQERSDGPLASRAGATGRGLRNQGLEHAGRLNVLA